MLQKKKVQLETEEKPTIWALHINGSSSKEGSRIRLILIGLEEQKFEYALWFEFLTSNNKTNYEVLIQCMELARKMGAHKLVAHNDSQLVVKQVNRNYKAKS